MNHRRVAAVARKEFLHVLRDARSMGMAVAIPMLMLLLYGYALTLDGTAVASLRVSTDGALGAGCVGPLTLTGELRAGEPLRRLVDGRSLGKPRLVASGSIRTPHGTVRLRKRKKKR